MKVCELIERLQDMDPDREVILRKDSEGNDYSPVVDVGTGMYRPDTSWSGEFGLEEFDEEAEELGYSEEDVFDDEDDLPAVVLIPAN